MKTICLCNSGDNPINTLAPKAGEPAYFNCDFGIDDTDSSEQLPEGELARYVDPARYVDKF